MRKSRSVNRRKLEPGIEGHRGRIDLGCREARSAESSGSRRSPSPPVEGRRRGLALRLIRLFDRCLSRGEFPVLWKEGRMVLLPKPGWSSYSPSVFRPVCLLDEAGKLLERVVAARLESHLSGSVLGLHDS